MGIYIVEACLWACESCSDAAQARLLPEFEGNSDRRPGGLRQVVNRAFNSGYALVVLGGGIFLGALEIVVQKLDPKDLKDLVGGAFANWLAGLGWLLFLVGSAIYLVVVRWMKVRYEAEIARQREIIDRFLPPDKRKELELE